MLEFNEKLFIFDELITVRDLKNSIKNIPEELKYNADKPFPHKYFYIKFSSTIPENIKDSSNALFTSFNIDEKFVRKTVIKECKNPKDPKQTIKYIYFPNFALLKTADLITINYVLAYFFNIDHNSITSALNYDNGNFHLCSNVKRDFANNEKDCLFAHQKANITESYTIFYKILCIGDNHNLNMIIQQSNNTELANYEELFYKEYYLTISRFKHILENVKKQNINRLKLAINYSQITVLLAYHAPYTSHTSIDIAKLFNIHHPWNYSKIYIQSDNIDNYLSNPRQIQYVKTSNSATNVFKGVEPLFNTCALYSSIPIKDGLALNHIEIFPSMNINLVFTNINVNLTWEEIEETLKTWIDENYIDVLKKAKLTEAIYSLDFKYEYYVPYFSKMSGSLNIPNLSLNDIDTLNEILQQESCKIRFKTRTSMEFNTYQFHSVATKQNYVYLRGVHEFITIPIVYKELLPSVHVGMNDSGGILTFKDVNSYDELLFTLGFVIGSFNKLGSLDMNNSEALAAIEKSSKLDIEEIRKKATKYGKNLLKLLEKIDPKLFGPRKIGKGIRSFSGLCQKQKQRVVPITKEEYDYLHEIVPNSVVSLVNQTYDHQRVYLFCPFKKYPFLNYHSFPHQICIVRCTTKSSNKTQYNFCATDLGAEHIADINNKYENQTITLYNPLITKGRRCKLPDEFKMILVNFVLIKLNIDSNVMKYCKEEFDKVAFIIKRDFINSRYLILTEYNAEYDYVLIICDEVENEYFLVIDEKTNKPLVFSECPELMKFFIENIRKTNEQYNFFNFLEVILKTKLSEQYEQTTNNILAHVRKEFNVKYVCQSSRIVGIVFNDKLYMTPNMYWTFETDIGTTVLFKALDDVLKKNLNLPSVDEFEENDIGELYSDYNDKMCHMVKFKNVNMWVEPFEISLKWSLNHDVITFDANAKLMNLYNLNLEKNYSAKSTQIKILDIAEVLRNYIYIYLVNYDKIDVDAIRKELTSLGVVYDGKTFIDYVNNKYKVNISWRTSKININDFNDYFTKYADLNPNSIIKTVYDKLQEELAFRTSKTEMINSKIITI